MIFVLFLAGKGLKRNGGKVLSFPGLMGILAYTLNEGLRFGRDIDYNEYWRTYERISIGYDSNRDMVFVNLCKFLSEIGVPFQGFIILCSFMFIFGAMLMLRNYLKILPWSLPLFSLLSLLEVECLIRWFLGFSFIMIGMDYLLKHKTKHFFAISLIGPFFHIGLLPIPFLFYFVYRAKGPFVNPYISILLYIGIGLLFQTQMMIMFADAANLLGSLSQRAEGYAEQADYWLTSGSGGRKSYPFPNILMMFFLFAQIWCGYKLANKCDKEMVFPYNLFLIGFLVSPMANQIEILQRYNMLFFIFRGIVCAGVIYYAFIISGKKLLKISAIPTLAFSVLLFGNCIKFFIHPFTDPPKLYMYVWDHTNETYDQMFDEWTNWKEKKADSRAKSLK